MSEDIMKQAEGILEETAFWQEYEGATSVGAWQQAHNLLTETLLPKLFENHNKMVEYLKQRDELISKHKELIAKYEELKETSAKVIKHYEGKINEYESRGGQR